MTVLKIKSTYAKKTNPEAYYIRNLKNTLTYFSSYSSLIHWINLNFKIPNINVWTWLLKGRWSNSFKWQYRGYKHGLLSILTDYYQKVNHENVKITSLKCYNFIVIQNFFKKQTFVPVTSEFFFQEGFFLDLCQYQKSASYSLG